EDADARGRQVGEDVLFEQGSGGLCWLGEAGQWWVSPGQMRESALVAEDAPVVPGELGVEDEDARIAELSIGDDRQREAGAVTEGRGGLVAAADRARVHALQTRAEEPAEGLGLGAAVRGQGQVGAGLARGDRGTLAVSQEEGDRAIARERRGQLGNVFRPGL